MRYLPLFLILTACHPEGSFPPAPPAQRLPLFGVLSVTPESGAGNVETFDVLLQQAAGKADPAFLGLLISPRDTGAGSCYLYASLASGLPRLVKDNGSGADELSVPGKVANRQCELSAGRPVISREGSSRIHARFQIKFNPSFAGPKKLYVIAEDAIGKSTGIQLAGAYQVQ